MGSSANTAIEVGGLTAIVCDDPKISRSTIQWHHDLSVSKQHEDDQHIRRCTPGI